MNRLCFLLLLVGFGLDASAVKADPIAPNTTGNAIDATNEKARQSLNVPLDMKGKLVPKTLPKQIQPGKKLDKSSGKPIGKLIMKDKSTGNRPLVGDFGPLPTNSYKPKTNNDGDVPQHPSDFGTVRIESGPDTRKAK